MHTAYVHSLSLVIYQSVNLNDISLWNQEIKDDSNLLCNAHRQGKDRHQPIQDHRRPAQRKCISFKMKLACPYQWDMKQIPELLLLHHHHFILRVTFTHAQVIRTGKVLHTLKSYLCHRFQGRC